MIQNQLNTDIGKSIYLSLLNCLYYLGSTEATIFTNF